MEIPPLQDWGLEEEGGGIALFPRIYDEEYCLQKGNIAYMPYIMIYGEEYMYTNIYICLLLVEHIQDEEHNTPI